MLDFSSVSERIHLFISMGSRQALFLIITFIVLRLSVAQLCPIALCRAGDPIIRFPFRLQNYQYQSCGYPGFNLSCDAIRRTRIALPGAGQFTLQGIDYEMQHIWLNDPDNCLPKRLLNLNLSGSPFSAYFNQNFAFFNCTSDAPTPRFRPIECLSDVNYTVFASSSEVASRLLASRCKLMKTVAVPVQWSFFEPLLSSDLSDDIRLTWAEPRCGRCVSRGGRCRLKNNSTTAVQCSYNHHVLPNGARYAIIVGAGVPALLFLMGLLCCLCSRVKHYARGRQVIADYDTATAPPPRIVISGLDDPTIESYPKTVLGESRRLPKPDDSVCSICLSEYSPKETLRTIPECQHSFHAECIDEWLRLKASCPICRNSPKSSPVNQGS